MVSGGEQVDGTAAQPIVEIANLDRVELGAKSRAYAERRFAKQPALERLEAVLLG